MNKIKPRLLTPGGDHAFKLPKSLADATPVKPMTGAEWRVLGCLLWFAWTREVWRKWDGRGAPKTCIKAKTIAREAGFAKSRGDHEVWSALHGLAANRLIVDFDVVIILELEVSEKGSAKITLPAMFFDIYHESWQPHGFLDLRHLAELETALDCCLYFRLMVAAQGLSPVIEMPVHNLASVAGLKRTDDGHWRRMKPMVLDSLQRVAKVMSARIGVEVFRWEGRPEPDRLRMLVRRESEAASAWMRENRIHARSWEVTGAGSRETSRGCVARD